MRIGIIGSGNVGGVLGKRWAEAGHEIMYGARDPSSRTVAAAAKAANAQAGTVAEASAFAEVVVLATPYDATQEAIDAAGDLSGKVVLDCTNPVEPYLGVLSIGFDDSGGESVARWARGARVVKTLNSTGSGNMAAPVYGSERASMFVCGDDDGAKAVATELVDALGFDVVDAGPLTAARLLEPLAMLWVSLAYKQGIGPDIALRLMRR